CVFPDQPLPIGVGGVTIESDDPAANLEIFMNDLWLDYSFNSLALFYQKDASSFDFSVRDLQGRELAFISAQDNDSSRDISTASWSELVNAVNIQSVKTNESQTKALVYGAVLRNSNNGVLYHTIGVNGAKYKHYNEAKHFASQTAGLKADVFIISLGTNESIDYPNVDRTFTNQVDALVRSLKSYNPKAVFILVTPQDVFRRKNRPNPGIRNVRDQIIRYAVENGLALYDLYRAMGGEDSAKRWSENSLLRPDGVHLTKEVYEYQGNLFYQASIKGYNSYVPDRHP